MSGKEHRQSALSTLLIMSCTLSSRILGFVRTAAIGALFGAGGQADVIHLIFNIPNNLRKLLAEGALSTAFIPELSREIARNPDGSQAPKLVQSILGLQTIIIVPLLMYSLAFPGTVLAIFERFKEPEKTALSVVLFRWMIPYLLLVSVSALMMAVHNTLGRFFIPAITPIAFSICVITTLLLGQARWGALSIGIGVLLGGIAQIVLQYPTYVRLGYRLIPSFTFTNPAFLRVMRKWVPMLITSSLFVLNNQVAMLIASFLPDKSASSLANAIIFYQLPFGIFSASITTVLYPKMSKQSAAENRKEMLGSLEFGYRNLWAFLLPSAVALILLGEPIIAVAFQRRAFVLSDTIMTSRVLAAYAVGMPFVGLFNITQRAFYAMGEVKKPFYLALGIVSIDIVFSLLFVFFADGGSVSLAWANSIAFIIGAIVQFLAIRKYAGFVMNGETVRTFLKVTLASAAMAVLMISSRVVLGTSWWSMGSSWSALGILLTISMVSAGLIFALYWWLRVEAVSIILKKGNRHENVAKQ